MMSRSRLPLEISDYIVDLLHNDHKTLKACCIVSKSWVPRVRKHLFREVAFRSLDDFEAWQRTFPDPVGSPGYYTRFLYVTRVQDILAVVLEQSGCIRAFSNVVRLWVRGAYLCSRFLPQLLTRSLNPAPPRSSRALFCLVSFQARLLSTRS